MSPPKWQLSHFVWMEADKAGWGEMNMTKYKAEQTSPRLLSKKCKLGAGGEDQQDRLDFPVEVNTLHPVKQ